MSVEMPPELAWVARLAVGQSWPKGDEDNLHALGQAWNEAAQELRGISGQLGASGNGVLESVGGQVADEFRAFVTQLESSLPEMAESANQLGKLGKHTGVQVEYSKYMILGQLILLAAQIAQWIFFAPEVIPLAITAARIAVKMILRRLLISVATGVALNVGLDVAVQTIQFLKGDRTEWSTDNTVSAVVSGAIGGAVGGVFFGAGGVLAPKFAHSLLGKGILGAATGLGTSAIMYGIYHSGEDEFGTSISAGALGALGGGGKRRFGGKGDTVKVDPVHVNVPGALTFDLPGLVSETKAELSAPDTFKTATAATATAGTNGTGHSTGSSTTTSTGRDTDTAGTGNGASHSGSSTTAHASETAHDTSTAGAAPHEEGLPGFTTTVIGTAQTSTAHTAASSATAASTIRTGTGAAAPTRGTPEVGGTTAAQVSRPATTAGAGNSIPGGSRPPTVSSGADRVRDTGTTGPTPSTRTETGTSARTDDSAASPRTESGAPATADTATAGPAESTAAASTTANVRTDTVPTPRDTTATATASHEQAAVPTPDPTPPPGRSGPAPRMTLDRTPRFVVRSAYEARRFLHRNERFTDLTVRVAFREGGSGSDTDAVWNRMSEGVAQFLNTPAYHLPNGDRLHVTVVRARPGEVPHLTVDLVGRDRAMDQRSWWPDADPVDFAHEIAHQIGLRDEYRDRTTPHRPAVEGSLQGDYRAAAPDGLRQAGLRDRHLQLIGAGIGDLGEPAVPRHTDVDPAAGPAPQTPSAAHEGAPSYDTEWARARQDATGHERRQAWVDPVSDPLGVGRVARPPATGGRTTGARTTGPAVAPRMHQPPTGVHAPDNSLIMQPGYASGDQFGILATLLAEPNAHVLIAGGPDVGHEGHDPVLDKSRAIKAFYVESGIEPGRIKTLNLPRLEQGNVWKQLNQAATRIARDEWLIAKDFHEMYEQKELWGVTSGTDYVAQNFSDAMRSSIRAAWKLEDHRDAQVTDWLAGRGVRIPGGEQDGKGVLVLWSRFTGKATNWSDLRGRMEHDTSFEGTRQLLRNLAADYRAVIITGDPHPDPTKAGKWNELVQEMRAELGTEHIHDLTGFWRGSDTGLSSWGGDTRTGQFRLYDHLNRRHGGVQHIGFRSGNLEAVALIGHRVRYLEEGDATGSLRMEAWHDRYNGLTRKGGLAPGYERTVVADPPTASGRHAKDFQLKPELMGEYQPPEANSPYRKPIAVYAAEHGFGYPDVRQIREDLGLTGHRQGQRSFDAARLGDVRRRYLKATAVIRQYADYYPSPKAQIEEYLGAFDAFLGQDPATYQGGASQMYEDFVAHYLPQFSHVWQMRRTVEYNVWAAYYQQANAQQAVSGADEVGPRAPQADTVVPHSDGTAMTTRPPRAQHPAEPSPDHPSASAVPTTDGFAELRRLSSAWVTESEGRSRYGMPAANFRKFRDISAAHGLRIDVRPTNPTAAHWLEEGKLPKPKDIKAKSINDLDVQLGAKAEHQGLIGYFQPVMPDRAGIAEPVWNRLEARFAQRAEEFATLAPVMARLQDEGRFKVEDGLVFGRDGEEGWKEITGDHDVFDISTPGGTRLKGEPYDRLVDTMMANDMAVMHGAHMDWEPSTPFSKGIFSKIVESHQEGGEPLLRFRPGANDAELVHAPSEFRFKGAEPEPLSAEQPRPTPITRKPPPDEARSPLAHGHMPADETQLPLDTARFTDDETVPVIAEAKSGTAGADSSLTRADSVAERARPPLARAESTGEQPQLPPAQPESSIARAQSPDTGGTAERGLVREPEPEPMVVEPEGDPMTPPPPRDDPGKDGDPAPQDHRLDRAEPPAEPLPEPPAGPPGRLGGRYQRSLAGIRITDAPGPEALRARVLETLPAAHRADRQVVQRLDAEFDPANFRARHEEMVNGGWRFQLRVGGAPHDVVLRARPGEWRLREERPPGGESTDPKGFERSAAAKRENEPRKTSLTTSEAGLDLAPTTIRPIEGHPDRLIVVTPSVKAGGATHATDTSVKTASATGTKTALTGLTDTYVSDFHYEVETVGPDGRALPRPAGPGLHADVTAEIVRTETDRADGSPARWTGWENDRPGRVEGRPLDVTGLSALHADVFRHLPSEERPDGTAHRDILEFLSPKSVLDGFEHAAGWGLTSKRLDLSGGGHAWLRLTLLPGTSVSEGAVTDKETFTSQETGEHSAGRTGTSTWGLGLNAGGARRVWESRTNKESTWLTVTGGYSYAHSQAHQEKGKQTFAVEHSLEHAGTADLVRTAVRFRVEVLREHLSPGTDGLHAVRAEPDPGPERGRAPRDEENPPAVRTGEVVRVRPRPAATATEATAPPAVDGDTGPGAPDSRPAPGALREPLTAQRTAFVDVPGSAELERHITDRLRELAPGVLPPPDGTEGRVTPQAMENQRLLRERVSRSGLRADGGHLLDGTFRITLDASHLPGLPGRTYEVVVAADTGAGRYDGAVAATAKDSVARGHASDTGVTRGGKHTLGAAGALRAALNPRDSVRAFGLGGVDGSYAPSRQAVASSETRAKRAFQHKGQTDAFSYAVTYRVLVGPHRAGDPPGTLPAGGHATGAGPEHVREVRVGDADRLRVEIRRREISASAPAHLRSARLPQLHSVTRVSDEAGFRRQARTALRQTFESRSPATDGEPHVPELDTAVEELAGRTQLPGLVSASHSGWANTLDRHVGDGRAPDTVGLSVRTRLSDLTYQETLSGDGTLELELTASGATTLADQTSWSLKGSIGPDFGRFPETPTGALTTGYQLRGGGKAKAGGQWDDVDTVKQQTSTTRKTGRTGTWHVYRATAEVSVAGRVTDASGASHVGRPVRRDHEVFVLLSDEDVTRPASDGQRDDAPPTLRATLLDQGVSGGVMVELPDTDPVLREIDRQLRGPNDETVPVAALPFADTYSPDTLAARYDELVGPGILDRHIEVTRAGHVVTEVLVRGITDGWRDDGSRSDRSLTREVTTADTVKGKAGGKGTLGVEGTLRAAVRPPVPHLDSASLAPAVTLEGSRGSTAESGVTTTVGHKTSGFGDANARFTTGLRFEVTVTRRTETGRFVHLPKDPESVGPYEATAWVPESLTQTATAPSHPRVPDDTLRPAPLAAHPFDIELHRLPGPGDAEHTTWQNALRGAHDLVGFDNTKSLYDTAVQVQATPRPWGEGVLGRTGAYYSWALAQATTLAGRTARSTLPEYLTGTVTRFVETFTADPRLGREHDLSQEQRLTPEQQFAIRQAFSGQSLPALFHRLGTPDVGHRVPGTSVTLSMEAIGPAEEIGRRAAADDELSVAVKDESGTAATHTYNWSVSPLDFTVLTDDPVVTVPLATGRLTRDQTYDSTRPVTRTPGTPGRPTPDPTAPHSTPPTEPGRAKVTGRTALLRQPVRITLRSQDDEGTYGTPRTVTGHLFHWSASDNATAATPERPPHSAPAPSSSGGVHRPTPPSASGSALRPSARSSANSRPRPAGSSPSGSSHRPTTPSPLGPPRRRPAAAPPSHLASSATGSAEVAPRAPAAVDGASAPQGPPAPAAESRTLDADGHTVAQGDAETITHGVAFTSDDATTLTPEDSAHLDTLAADVAHDAVRRAATGLGLPEILVTGHATASVSGLPHFGRAIRIGAERAEAVREVFARRLDAHLRDLDAPLTSDAFTITAESRGSDLPHGTDPAQDTPQARRRAVVTVTRPLPHETRTPAVPPSVRPEQWRSRRGQAGWAVLRTERYDPARDPSADRPAPGLLAGRDVVVRAAVARIQADDGRWVRNLSLHLPVRFGAGFGPADLGAYRERLQSLLDTHVNGGRRLPGSGDHLHIDVELEHRPDHPEAVEISRGDAPEHAWDQFTFPLGTHEGVRDDARALHELLHYVGVPDRYHDDTTLFRRLEGQSDRSGLMADIDTIDVPDTYLRAIAEVTDSGPVLRDLPYTEDDGRPAAAVPGLTEAAARETLLTVDPDAQAPARAPAAAPFADRSAEQVAELVGHARHEYTAMDDGGGRNWRGPGRPRFDPTRYHVRHDDGNRDRRPTPWADGAYVVLARVRRNHVILETPHGDVELTRPEDFAALLADDPIRPPDADIVLAVRGLPQDALGLPQAVFAATGNRVWTPSGGSLELRTVRAVGTVERIELSGRDPQWAPTTSAAGPDHFAHLRARRLVTEEYTIASTADDPVLFHRLPGTRLEAFHPVSRSDPRSAALIMPTQELDTVHALDRPALQVSQDRTLAVDTGGLSQQAYATGRAVDEANARLAAAGSKVRLEADPEVSLTLTRDGGPSAAPLLRVTPRFLTGSGRSEEETCRDFAQMVSGQVRASHVVFRVPGRVATGRISALDTAEVTGTHHLAESLVELAEGRTDPAATGPSWAAAQVSRDDRGVGGQGGAPLPGRAYGSALSYARVDDPRRHAMAGAARRIGINEGAWAEVGESYLIQSINAADAEGRPTLAVNYAKPEARSGSHFGYHFASVVLASEDGQSQLTLENHARVSRNDMEMNAAVEENLRSSAAQLRALALSLHARADYAKAVDAPAAHRSALTSRAGLADRLVMAREARDAGAPEEEQRRTFRLAATAMKHTAPMIDGKAQWYFRSYSKRPGESMHESHAELLSDHVSAEANPLTLVVLHGHAVSAPEHRYIPFDASDVMPDSAGYKLDHLAEHVVRTGLWNVTHDLRLPTVRLTGHGDGPTPHLDRARTTAMATRVRDELRTRIAAVLHDRAATVSADDFTITVAAGLHRHAGRTSGPQVAFEVDHWRTLQDDDPGRHAP
ncbi:hypothetical protein ACIQPR_46375 [Streptomyces sp. NPDC091280]|uniref:WXG100-like domain-containing protein n=1 Tax=Streptomyces sp. NPDC091280 TaxID=3365984 RepID=UPI00382221B9